MRCLHYIDEIVIEKGGVVRAVLDLVGGLAKAGVQVTLLTGDEGVEAPKAWREGEEGAPRVVPIDRTLAHLGGTSVARRLLAEETEKADVVHLHTPWDPFNPVVAAAARAAGTPYVVSTHGMLDDWCMAIKGWKKTLYLNLVAKRLLRNAARLHFTAVGERDQSLRRLPEVTTEVLPLLLDLVQYTRSPEPEDALGAFPKVFADRESPRVLFLGRLHPIKGLDLLIDAVGRLGDDPWRPRLVFAGPYEEHYRQQLLLQAERLGLRERVDCLGMVHGELKRSLYAACDLFVLPSHHENFGIALAEAMCSGVPVLTNRSVNIWPEVERLGGVVVDDNVESLARGLRKALGDLDRLKEQAQANRSAVLEWLDPAKLCARYVEMYERASEGVSRSK